MPELINQQQRTLQVPGQGIVTPPGPTRQYQEYPKLMRHPGYAPATIGQEVVHESGKFKYYVGGTAQRYPHVLVHSAMDEEHHKSLGYESKGSCSGAEFARMVQTYEPAPTVHVPEEYPKWVQGKLVKTAAEEAALTGKPIETSSEPAGAPALDTEVNTLTVFKPKSDDDEIAALEARLAEIKAKKADKARRAEELKAAIAAELAEEDDLVEEPKPHFVASPVTEAPDVNADKADKLAARVAKQKATLARKKAERMKTEGNA